MHRTKVVYPDGSIVEPVAWHKAERDEPEDNVFFVSWSALTATMTDKRYDLLRHLRRHAAPGIRALEAIGPIEKRDGELHADYGEIRAPIQLEMPAA